VVYLEELDEETAIRQIVTYFFETKGVNLEQLKNDAKKRDIVYSRFTKPPNSYWSWPARSSGQGCHKNRGRLANSRKLDYAIETVFKKWLELDRLQPKERSKNRSRQQPDVLVGGQTQMYSSTNPASGWNTPTKKQKSSGG